MVGSLLSAEPYDVVVVGAGIVGLAIARRLLTERPDLKLVVLEKEDRVAAHQSSHNSGVIHRGMYYETGSMRARLCVEGAQLMIEYCSERGIPFDLCGKVIVASTPEQRDGLAEIDRRGAANGVPELELVSRERLAEIEPHVEGIAALYSPRTGVVDYAAVANALAEDVEALGGSIALRSQVVGFAASERETVVETTAGAYAAGFVVSCPGLHSDRLARLAGAAPTPKIVPFRGRYYRLSEAAAARFNGLVYPVPDPHLPFFLGVHFTKHVDGSVWAGPTAVLAFAREGYRVRDVRVRELLESLAYPGFRALMRRAWRQALNELNYELRPKTLVRDLRVLTPWLGPDDVLAAHSGVRAQALTVDGSFVDDFWFDRAPRMLHVRNAPSPAATSSLAIARHVVGEIASELPPASAGPRTKRRSPAVRGA